LSLSLAICAGIEYEILSYFAKTSKESGIFFRLVTKHMGPQASSVVRASRAP
jgi:hypothetical protein